ncbi:hypothetical protein [Testudinibacter sp. TR-2022]|uniref:hypothetical protein n=1 Tax=Testudinibacter sp. TR-2022 TaxID=2585029 RepID=UPI00159BA1A1|nr:hypothetical protein [Testudinibacter sp. TR-2022]
MKYTVNLNCLIQTTVEAQSLNEAIEIAEEFDLDKMENRVFEIHHIWDISDVYEYED